MISTNEVVKAIERLKAAGYGARYKPTVEAYIRNDESCILFNGWRTQPGTIEDNIFLDDPFSVLYQLQEPNFSAHFFLAQADVPIKTANQLETVVTAVMDYFQLKTALLEQDTQRRNSLSSPECGLLTAVFWLQRAGANVEINSACDLQITFSDHIYVMHLTKHGWAVETDGKKELYGEASLEDAVLEILVQQRNKA